MRIAIMQPYFFPYIGYWQMMNLVDKYVVYDDVNFIKGGWINRNRILVNGEVKYFNVNMIGASSFKLINEVEVNNDKRIVAKNLRIIEAAYRKAPYFNEVFPIVSEILNCEETNLAKYIVNSFRIINEYLGIDTELIISSELNKDCSLKGQDKIITICKLLNADIYCNAIGGMELYSFDEFERNNIQLEFLDTNLTSYYQNSDDFVPGLSILDIMMFNSKEQINKMLNDFSIITKNSSCSKVLKR